MSADTYARLVDSMRRVTESMEKLARFSTKCWLPDHGSRYHMMSRLTATRCGRSPWSGRIADSPSTAESEGFTACARCYPAVGEGREP